MSEENQAAGGERGEERRRAVRLRVDYPTTVMPIAAPSMEVPVALARVYERVLPAPDGLGQETRYAMRDLSTNGAFLEGTPPLPLLSRVRLDFELAGHGHVTAIGWTMWRRREACELETDEGGKVTLAAGVGVLFEALDLSVRMAIARRTNELAAAEEDKTAVRPAPVKSSDS